MFCFLSLCCISLLGIAKDLEPLLIAYSNLIAMSLMVLGENAHDSFLVLGTLCTLSTSLHRSAPAQPPTEGEEGTAPGGGPPGPPPNTSSNRRLQQTQAQVEEVSGKFFFEFPNYRRLETFLFYREVVRSSGRQGIPWSYAGQTYDLLVVVLSRL